MHLHLAFVKLERDDDDVESDTAARLISTLKEALSPWSPRVMPAADHHARLAWDVAIAVEAEPSAMEGVTEALDKALLDWPVGASKGWSFVSKDPAP